MSRVRSKRPAIVTLLVLFAFARALSGASARATTDEGLSGYEALMNRQPQGPSFDCKRALSSIEHTICSDAALSRLDLQLQESYAANLTASQHALSDARDESAWLSRRDLCTTAPCLGNAYRTRIATLDRQERHWGHLIDHQALGRGYLRSKTPPAILAKLKRLAGRKCFAGAVPVDAGDGRTSYLVTTCDGCLPVAEAIVYHPEGNGFRSIYRAPECYVSNGFGGFQDERRNGLRRIATFSRGGAALHYEDFFDYDGSQYRHVATIVQYGYGGIVITRDWTTIEQWQNEAR